MGIGVCLIILEVRAKHLFSPLYQLNLHTYFYVFFYEFQNFKIKNLKKNVQIGWKFGLNNVMTSI